MPLPIGASKSNPRKTVVVVVRCFKSDYKAESCQYKNVDLPEAGCDLCSPGGAISNFDVIDTVTINDPRKVKDVLVALEEEKVVKRPVIKKPPKKPARKKKARKRTQ